MKAMEKAQGTKDLTMERRILRILPAEAFWDLETIDVQLLEKDPREDYLVLSGEPLCQYLLRQDPEALIIARGPTPFLTGNKTTVGYISPLTGLPHFSYVGGRVAAQMFNLGLDAILLQSSPEILANHPILVVSGDTKELEVAFKDGSHLPPGQRGALYWLIEKELGGDPQSGSVLTIGEGASLGYKSANLAAEGIYHAGRGGAGAVFARFAAALVLRGEPRRAFEFFGEENTIFANNPNREITPLIDQHCHRLSSRTGGTIIKLYKTGGQPAGENTLPAWNAQNLGYAMADAGDESILKATREGQAGCHWCQVHCRHYHSVPADYAPDGTDLFLDDFEPAYAVHAMLGLVPVEDTLESRLRLIAEVDERLMRPIEQMGLDVIDTGVALSALFEGVSKGIVPDQDVPGFISGTMGLGNLESVNEAVDLLSTPEASQYPALCAVGDGPQALADLYPEMQDILFTCGEKTLGNPGHCNALWTFMMPFSRYFSHYTGQTYKIKGSLPPTGSDHETLRTFGKGIIEHMLQREYYWLLANAFSHCAFTFVIFSQDGAGDELSEDGLFVRLLQNYDIHFTNDELKEFGRKFWAQSIDLKRQYGWRPQMAEDFPKRVYEALSISLDRSAQELQELMGILVEEWKDQASRVLTHYGYSGAW